MSAGKSNEDMFLDAAYEGNMPQVQQALQRGVDVNHVSPDLKLIVFRLNVFRSYFTLCSFYILYRVIIRFITIQFRLLFNMI